MPFIGLSKPTQQQLSSKLVAGSEAPNSYFIQPNNSNLVLFLRHTGCPFAEAALKKLSDYARNSTTHCIAIFHGKPDIAECWSAPFKLSPKLELIFDEERIIYGEWGVGYSKLNHLLHPMMPVALIRLALKGIRNRDASGTRWQQQVAFLVNKTGTIEWSHFPKHAGDIPIFPRVSP